MVELGDGVVPVRLSCVPERLAAAPLATVGGMAGAGGPGRAGVAPE